MDDGGGWEGLSRKRPSGQDAAPQDLSCQPSGQDGPPDPSGGGGPQPSSNPSVRPPIDEMANKLDSLMELLFDYLTARMSHEGGPLKGLSPTWACLLSSFERSILPTQRSKFTQYLIFHASSLHPQQVKRLVPIHIPLSLTLWNPPTAGMCLSPGPPAREARGGKATRGHEGRLRCLPGILCSQVG